MMPMRALLSRILILLAVIGLIFTPPVVAGYADLRKAGRAWAAREYASAAAYYEHAALLLPWRPGLWEMAGRSAFLNAEDNEALLFFQRADRLSDVGWATLAIIYRMGGNYDLAEQTIQQGLVEVGASRILYATLWETALMEGDLAEERDALEMYLPYVGELRHENPTKSLANYRMGVLLFASDTTRALHYLQEASGNDADYASVVETLRTSANLAALETDESKKLVVIGRGLGLVNEWALAEQAFRQAVAADGDNAEAWAWLGEAGQQLGRDGRAALDRALSLGPANPVVRSLRGLYWTRQGQSEQALAEYQSAAEFDPGNPLWQVSMAEAYAGLGDLPPALEAYLRAVELAPGDANYWRLLAVFCVQYGVQVEETGLPAARQAATLAPDDPQVLDTLGWTVLTLGRADEARYHLARALALAPDFALAHLHFGLAALQENDRTEAYRHLLRARELDANGAVSVQAQALLSQYFP